VDDLLRPTQLALDLAAPVEGACATLDDDDLLCPVPSAAAHQIAAIYTNRCVVALTAVGALDTKAGVSLTETGRRFQVDEIFGARWLVVGVVWLQLEVVSYEKIEIEIEH
jgi:hypothetical protein